MQQIIDSISNGVPDALGEVITLGQTLKQRPQACWRTSIAPARPTARPKRSTAGSNISAVQPSRSATSPTTSPDHYWRPAASDPNSTVGGSYQEGVPLSQPGHPCASSLRPNRKHCAAARGSTSTTCGASAPPAATQSPTRGRDHPLIDTPRGLDLDVLLAREQVLNR